MPKSKVVKQRHDPLHVAIEEGSGKLRPKNTKKQSRQPDQENDDPEFVDSATTRKILNLARAQIEEIEQEEAETRARTSHRDPETTFDDLADDVDAAENWVDSEDDDGEYAEYEELEVDVDPEEEAIFQRYMDDQNGGEESVNLADKVMEKIHELEMRKAGIQPQAEGGVMLPPKVIVVYSQVGELLSRYRSGRLPRAFKIIPTLKNWRDVLYVTSPETWSNQAIYEGTKLFVSNLQANQAQKFLNEIVLDRFRGQIRDDKTVNYHVYRALKKALYKPAAFFKGFLFPLVESGTCSLREAQIASSILARVSIPALHSAAALLRLAEMDYSGPNSLFIRVLLDKKYALPYKVVDAMVFHFLRFKTAESVLPVIWHQSFLTFSQRYKNDVTEDQRDALMMILRVQNHPTISAEIRRELMAGTPRTEDDEMVS